MSARHLSRAGIVDINLLPSEYRPAQVSWMALAVAAVLAALLLAMIPLAFRLEAAKARADDALELAKGAEFELSGVEAGLARQRSLRIEIELANAQADALRTERTFMQGGTRPLSDDLFWLYGFGFLPPGARITSVTGTQTGFKVDGVASGPLDGISFAEKLVAEGGFQAARMTAYTPGSQSAGQFTVEVTR
jgi:hypothetical protein